MDFEWDEDKRQINLEKHRLDFKTVEALFDGRAVFTVDSSYELETRYVSTGLVNGKLVTVVWTKRIGATRIISARGARDAEKRHYRSLHGEGN